MEVLLSKKQGIATYIFENTILAYFGVIFDLFMKNTISTLCVHFLMLKAVLLANQNINIASHMKLRAFLKRKLAGYKPKKSKILTAEEINKFTNQVFGRIYLLSIFLLTVKRRQIMYKL